MPLKSGIEVIKEVRLIYKIVNDERDDDSKIQELTFVFTTNITSQGFTQLLEQNGVTHVMSKPVEYKQLESIFKE
jgi:hypothetical protein